MAAAVAPKMSGGFLMQKTGPLPNWGWMVVAVVGLIVWNAYKNAKSSGGSTFASGNVGTGLPSSAHLPPGTALNPSDLILVNEGYNPPSVTINNNIPGGATAPAATGRVIRFSEDDTTGALYGNLDNGQEIKFRTYADYKKAGGKSDLLQHWQSIPGLDWKTMGGSLNEWLKENGGADAPQNAARHVIVGSDSSSWNSTLNGIAQHYYNDTSKATYLMEINGINNSADIKPGQKIIVP